MYSYGPPHMAVQKQDDLVRPYIQQLCQDTGCCPEDLPEAMNDREKWPERVRDIHATSTTWCWWWWFIVSGSQEHNRFQQLCLLAGDPCSTTRLSIGTFFYITQSESTRSVHGMDSHWSFSKEIVPRHKKNTFAFFTWLLSFKKWCNCKRCFLSPTSSATFNLLIDRRK